MFELMVVIAFAWLALNTLGLAFRLTWGVAKIVAFVLFVAAFPALIVGLVFAGGVMLLLPLAMIGAAFGLVKSC